MKRFLYYSLLATIINLCILPKPVIALDINDGSCESTSVSPGEKDDKFKAIVIEFVDPNNSKTGEGISRFLWREIRDATLDMKNTKVLFAHDEYKRIANELNQQDYRDYLKNCYHGAALNIAKIVDAKIAIWGLDLTDGNLLFVQQYLSIIDNASNSWLTFKLSNPLLLTGYTAHITHQRLSFAPQVNERTAFFKKSFRLRCAQTSGCKQGIELRSSPVNSRDNIIAYLPINERIQALDMVDQWLKVESTAAKEAFINVYNVDIKPLALQIKPGKKAQLRNEPFGQGKPIASTTDAPQAYEVLDMQRNNKLSPWFLINSEGIEGWVDLDSANRLYSFPVVHFIAGLYRFGRRDFNQATTEFDLFISHSKEEQNTTLAAAYQFMAAAMLQSIKSGNDYKTIVQALEAAGKAIAQTPYDPDAYTFRAYISFASGQDMEQGFKDLGEALELDHLNPAAQEMLEQLYKESKSGIHDVRKANLFSDHNLNMLDQLRAR